MTNLTLNLNVEHYRNGDPIPEVKDKKEWAKLETGAWCYYENDSKNGEKYGKLYNRYAVNDPRGLAPEGWHIPTLTELKNFTIMLLAGIRYHDGEFYGITYEGIYWSSNEGTTRSAFEVMDNEIAFNYYNEYGFSVRCVQD